MLIALALLLGVAIPASTPGNSQTTVGESARRTIRTCDRACGVQYTSCWTALPARQKTGAKNKRTSCAVQRAACRRDCRRS
jgi:hypothetical protein